MQPFRHLPCCHSLCVRVVHGACGSAAGSLGHEGQGLSSPCDVMLAYTD